MKQTYDDWTGIDWPYNSAIKLGCMAKTFKHFNSRGNVYVHQAYRWIDFDVKDGMGEWIYGNGFAFTCSFGANSDNSFSGRCPDDICNINDACKYLDSNIPKILSVKR